MKIIRTANHKKISEKTQEELLPRIKNIQDFETTIQLYKGNTDILEEVPVMVGWSKDDKGTYINEVTDIYTGEDLTDLVYDSVNKDIFHQLMSEINDIIGNTEGDYDDPEYDGATYDAERIPPNVAPDRNNTEPQDRY